MVVRNTQATNQINWVNSSMPNSSKTTQRFLLFLSVVGISLMTYIMRDQASHLVNYGYPGIFALSILANATVVLPAPGLLAVFAFSSVLSPFWVAITAGIGATIGELSGYVAGYSGQGVAENHPRYMQLVRWMQRNRSTALSIIFALAVIPSPLFDVAGVISGMLKIPVWQFIVAALPGKIIKMLLVAYSGFFALDWVFEWLS